TRAAARDACLLDRRPAARTRLPLPPVHPELVLHRSGRAVRLGVVAKGGALTCDARLERAPDRTVERPQLGLVERVRGAKGMDPGAPERLVGVDVPEPCGDALVEDRP